MLEAAVIAAMTACASFNMIYYYDVCQPNGVNNISKPLQVLRTDNFEQFSTLYCQPVLVVKYKTPKRIFHYLIIRPFPTRGPDFEFCLYHLGDLKIRKSTGTSCQIATRFSSQTSKVFISKVQTH